MSNYDLEEVELLNWQLILSSLFILSTLISLTLTYNQILRRKKQKPLYTSLEVHKVLRFNRLLATSIAIGFLVINVKDKKVRLNYNDCDEKAANMQIGASTLTLLATLVVLYLAFSSGDEGVDIENPDL